MVTNPESRLFTTATVIRSACRKPSTGNRTYLYNFLFDNCSTRVRDIVAKSILQPIEWHLPDMHKSFWNLLDEYLYRMPWVKWGIHTILAQSGSREATPYQYMFLPNYLMQGLETATLLEIKCWQKTNYLIPGN